MSGTGLPLLWRALLAVQRLRRLVPAALASARRSAEVARAAADADARETEADALDVWFADVKARWALISPAPWGGA